MEDIGQASVFKHPGVESALTLRDVASGVPFVTYLPGVEVLSRGVFMSGPEL